ncbi:MAG: WG repeat-containing protein, partial [Eubacteriales bacterium]
MGRIRQIGITLSLIGLLIFSWISVLTIESSEDKQKRLYDQAQSLMSDEIYVRAQPLLEEAVGISASLTKDSEEALKTVYLELIHLSGYESKYIALLEKQLSKETATPVEFFELAEYYFSSGKQAEAISVLREGADKTSDISLTERYEAERYAFVYGRVLFEEVTTFLGNTIQVQNGGLWGICSYAGKQIIPCTYEKISTYYNGVAIVQQEGEIYAVDGNSSKLYITAEPVYNFGNLSENRIAFFGESGLLRGNSQLTIASSELGFI